VRTKQLTKKENKIPKERKEAMAKMEGKINKKQA